MDHRELEQLFAFDRWANRQTLAALRTLEAAPPTALCDLLWHTLAAADNWLSRIDGTTPFEALGWTDTHALETIAAYNARVEPRSVAFVAALPEARLSETFEYRNSSGAPFTNVVADALQHVILHGVEHRGQIMYEIGKLGGQPVELEYAWFLRDPPPDA